MSPEQRNNLIKLADYLDNIPPGYEHFDMSHFITDCREIRPTPEFVESYKTSPTAALSRCGAVACALGHAPAAGLPLPDVHSDGMLDWRRYAGKLFNIPVASLAWDWMFGGGWEEFDNTAQGAAHRIRQYLAHGVPDGYHDGLESKEFYV